MEQSRINDILLKRNDGKSFFNSYVNEQEIGAKIFKSFKKIYQENQGFPIDLLPGEKKNKIGVISNCMGLSTLLELDDMQVDISEYNEEFIQVIQKVFEAIYGSGEIIFDTSPYMVDDGSGNYQIDTYIETASKIFIIMIDLRNFALKYEIQRKKWRKSFTLISKYGKRTVASYQDLATCAEELLLDAMKVLDDSCLKTSEAETRIYKINDKIIDRNKLPSKVEYRGWTYQNPNGLDDAFGTSIYFTYHATNAFVSFYREFADNFDHHYGNKEYNLDDLTEEQRSKHDRNEEFFVKNIKQIESFRNKTSASGRYIDMLLRDKGIDISFDYIRSGFERISSSQIFTSQKNNHVINTLFVLAIFVNAGIDEDYEYAGQKEFYNNQLQYSLTNIKKVYNIFKQTDREDSIDSFRLDLALFDEKYPNEHNKLVQKFRKDSEGVIVYDLIPLLCNTYAIMSDFIIQYPQKEMIENLEMIMDNRAEGENWHWGKTFNINNNLYYIFALENFYEYYNKYELPLTGNQKKYNEATKKVNTALEQKTKEYNALQEKYRSLEQDLKNKKSELDTAVYQLSAQMFEEKIDASIEGYLEAMLKEARELCLKSSELNSAAKVQDQFKQYPKAKILFQIAGAFDLPDIVKEDEVKMVNESAKQPKIQEVFINHIAREIKKEN